jgi:energy-converting hydrogenase Eha subunit A
MQRSVVVAAAMLLPRIPQPQSYHAFADQRRWLGIPNFGDVASNLLFALGGAWGLIFMFGQRGAERFIDPRERWAYVFVFLGLLLTAVGSSFYHLAPDNARLVWDRLSMTLAFMGLVSAMISERVGVRAGLYLLPVLLLIGAGSVILWWHSEARGAGDLRPYAAVQVYSVLVLPILLLLPPRYTRSWDFAVVFGFYVLAKGFEVADRQIFSIDQHTISGHTLKHLAAGAAGFWILGMLQKRKQIQV